ncbi:MAG: MBL fold metallo-hydrolase [Vicinamibacteria bacterium]
MKHLFLRVLFGLLFAAPTSSDDLTITPIAHAAIHLADGKRAVLVDFPYDAGADSTAWDAAVLPPGPKALCVITHAHRDHFAPELAERYCAAVAGPKDVVTGVALKSFAPGSVVHWEGVTVTPIATPHANIEHYSYLIDWRGARVFFNGDTNAPDVAISSRKLDAAFLTPSMLIAINKSGAAVDAGRIISYHHRPTDPVPNLLGRIASVPGQAIRVKLKEP